MSQSHSRSYFPSSSSSQTIDASEDKGDFKAIPDAFSAETSSSLDFLNMSNDELFDTTNDTAEETLGSLERLEGLLRPVEDGFEVSLKLSEPPDETIIDPLCDATCHSASRPSVPVEEDSLKTSFFSNDRLVQSTETIASLSFHEFMDLLKRYAFYLTDECFEFDRFTGEPVMTSYTVGESLGGKTDEHLVKDSAARSDNNASIEREKTPALTVALSVSPPSEGLISTPTDGGPSMEHLELRTAQMGQNQIATDPEPSSLRTRKRKRDNHIYDPRSSSSHGGCNSNGTAVGRGSTRNIKGKAKITGSNPLSTGFIIYRYGLQPVHRSSHRWSCPFPPHDALPNGVCPTSFDAGAIRSHIAERVDAYLAQHPGGKLECPRRLTEERCLPRHVAEVHLQVSAYTCPCSTSFSRGTRDQFVRHLRDGHERNLAVKRRTDPTVPDYVSVDDPRLVEEEKQ
ncbi:hypothetical protein ACEPAH_7458 [Sanghuangporus vaninii]